MPLSIRSTLRFSGTVRFLLLLGLMFLGASSARAVLRVRAEAPGPVHDGQSWDTAYTTLQAAVSAAASGDEIWVARGIYVGTTALPTSVSLYGGFAGTETELGARDPRANPTVLDGGGQGDVVTVVPASVTIAIDGFTIRNPDPDNGNGILVKGGPTTIAHCTITKCPTGIGQTLGAVQVLSNVVRGNETGIHITMSGAIVVANNVVASNETGIDCSAAASIMNNTVALNGTGLIVRTTSGAYRNNLVAWNGVGLSGAAWAPQYTCVFQNGKDAEGPLLVIGSSGNIEADPLLAGAGVGDFHLMPGSPCINAGLGTGVLSGWTDIDGEARTQDGMVDIGADEFNGTAPNAPTPIIVRVKPDGDDAKDGSDWAQAKKSIPAGIDALWGHGGEVWVAGGAYAEPVALTFAAGLYGGFAGDESTRAARHGGATVLSGEPFQPVLSLSSVMGPTVVDGFTVRDGGFGIVCSAGAPRIANCNLSGNQEGISVEDGSPVLVNDTIVSNARGVYIGAGSPSITNTLIAYNGVGLFAPEGSELVPALSHDGFFGNGATVENLPAIDPGGGNLLSDPALASPEFGNLHLLPGSPYIDAGDDAAVLSGETDMDNQPRIQGAHVDIGADESDGTAPTVTPRIVRVSPAGDDAKDGSSWEAAKRTLQAAVDAASAGGEVWAAAGTFEPVRLKAFAHLYGGFAGTETAREPRDPAAHVSTITSPNAEEAVFASGINRFATLDGFTIRDPNYGIRLEAASPRIAGNTFTGNGAAMDATDSAPIVERNTFAVNTDGLRFQGGAPLIRANRIIGQTIRGISCWDSAPEIRDNAVLGCGDAALYLVDSAGHAVNNTLIANQTGVDAAGATTILSNNLVAYNMTGAWWRDAAPAKVSFSSNAFWENRTPFLQIVNPIGTNGNVETDPKIASGAFGNIHLLPDSPLRGAGEATYLLPEDVDVDGQARVQDGTVDIGADESDGSTPSVAPIVVRVKPDGDDANDGSDWAHAKKSIGAGADAAAAAGGEVWVAKGVYDQPFTVHAFTYVYGGFAGTETAKEERDLSANATYISMPKSPWSVKMRGGYTFSTFDGFTVRDNQRGVSVMGGAPTIAHNTFTHNQPTASVITSGEADPLIVANVIFYNTYYDTTGSGLSLSYGAPVVANNLILNEAVGIQLEASAALIVNNTLYRTRTGIDYTTTEPTIANNIIVSENTGIRRSSSTATPVIRNNDVYGVGKYVNLPDQTGLNGNISADPLFVSQSPTSDPSGYRPMPGSPVIDAGDDSAVLAGWPDIMGYPRIAGAHVDMGALESPIGRPTAGDVAEALRIAAGLASAGPDAMDLYDVRMSGRVDMFDVLLLAKAMEVAL